MLLKPYPQAKQQKLIQDVLRLFISCMLLLYLVENQNFRTFLYSFDPRYKPPCVNTLKNKIANRTNYTTQPLLEEFNIKRSKILSITTDNSSNIKVAIIQLLASLSLSIPIANIFCTIHTLQLSVETCLVVVQNLITKYKALISLMSGEKKYKQLREAQIR
ncbi:2511_t:CDS:2, partial [Dentiscutata heterogama]